MNLDLTKISNILFSQYFYFKFKGNIYLLLKIVNKYKFEISFKVLTLQLL